MLGDLRPYPEYKESGLVWLGQIPKHWQMRPAFSVFCPINERNIGFKEKTILSLSYGRIIVKPLSKLYGLVPESFETYQIVNPNDIIIRPTDLQNDHTSLRVGIVRTRGIITSAYLVLCYKCKWNFLNLELATLTIAYLEFNFSRQSSMENNQSIFKPFRERS